MKEIPMLFNGAMVRALLDGSKVQTRRAMKPQMVYGDVCGIFPSWYLPNKAGTGGTLYPNGKEQIIGACPYGQPGERIWVRETFQSLYANGIECESQTDWKTGKGYAVSYPATDGVQEFMDGDDNLRTTCKPSIHMPRWASRIVLEIVSVRVERLQDISEADAFAEGVRRDKAGGFFIDGADGRHASPVNSSAVEAFKSLWGSTGGDWDANPWCWAITFKRVAP